MLQAGVTIVFAWGLKSGSCIAEAVVAAAAAAATSLKEKQNRA